MERKVRIVLVSLLFTTLFMPAYSDDRRIWFAAYSMMNGVTSSIGIILAITSLPSSFALVTSYSDGGVPTAEDYWWLFGRAAGYLMLLWWSNIFPVLLLWNLYLINHRSFALKIVYWIWLFVSIISTIYINIYKPPLKELTWDELGIWFFYNIAWLAVWADIWLWFKNRTKMMVAT